MRPQAFVPWIPLSGIALALLLSASTKRHGLHLVVNRLTPLSIFVLCFVLAPRVYANTQPLNTIQAAAEAYVRAHLPGGSAKHFVTASDLDPRLRLQACETPLEAFAPHTNTFAARSTIGVRCSAPAPWTLYVPVTIETEVSVLVLRRALARRAPVTLADVEPQVRRLPGTAANFISDTASLQGHRLRRALPAGSALTADALAPDILVRRGQQVTLIAQAGGVEIRARGQALTEGGAHDRVRVQNVSSLKVVEGIVESESVVRVGS